ncbi:hypothetical protein [Asticcacaulis solisilvae]|uniref:hypothetical protein n=1 Tax=Asticcacaulis solisilvae TaxID=1217274 RepID=UPI003FD7725F
MTMPSPDRPAKLPLDFAFEGFRIIRQSPAVIPFWGVVSLAGYLANKAIMQAMAGNAMQELQAASHGRDMAVMMAAVAKLLPALGVLIPLGIVLNAFLTCAVFRAIGGKAGAFGGLRLGLDEVRQFGVAILFFLIMFALYVVVIIAGSIVGGILSLGLGAFGMVLSIIAAIAVFFWFGARLSLAPAQSFAEGRIVMFGSWKLTEGNSLALVAGYVIALVMAALVGFLCFGIFLAGLAILKSGNALAVGSVMNAVQDADIAAMVRDPAVLVYVLLWNIIVAPLLMAITFGAPAAAYRLLSGRSVSAESVF